MLDIETLYLTRSMNRHEIKNKKPCRIKRQGFDHFNTCSYIDRVPIGERLYGTYPTQFLLLQQSVP